MYNTLQGIPVHIVKNFRDHRPEYLHIILPNGIFDKWELKWNESRPNQCHFGNPWYIYCKEKKFKPGRRISFNESPFNDTYDMYLGPKV